MQQASETHPPYWRKTLRITSILMAVWVVVTCGIGFFARDLDFNFFGWPFGFWMASQGALIIYVVIIWVYARYMNKLDREHGADAED